MDDIHLPIRNKMSLSLSEGLSWITRVGQWIRPGSSFTSWQALSKLLELSEP